MSAEQWNLPERLISRKRHFFLLTCSLLLILGSVSCSRRKDKTEDPEASVRTESRVLVPSYLKALEQAAEEVIELAGDEKWESAGEKVKTISTTWQDYMPQLQAEAESARISTVQQQIETLQTYAQLKERMNTMQAANHLSGLFVDLFELYHPAVPIGLERLDTEERQVLLDIESGKPEMAQIAVEKSGHYWNQLKSAVIYHGGEQLADKYQASLALQEDYLKAGKLDLLSAEVENGFEIIDMIEDLFQDSQVPEGAV